MVMCTRTDFPPYELETDAREDAVCPLHGPNLYTCPDGCAFAAAFPRHPAATLTGGAVPEHEPGAYPRLSCCGGAVALVPAHDATHGEPIISDGPGWGMLSNDRSPIDPDPDHGEALLFLEGRAWDANTDTRAELYVVARPVGGDGWRYEAGAELTVDDLAALAIRACELGTAAATQDGYHFGAEAFLRALEQLTRVYQRDEGPPA